LLEKDEKSAKYFSVTGNRTFWRHRNIWEDNIKNNMAEIMYEDADWNRLTQARIYVTQIGK
jgi:hypothetical protein